MWIVQTLRMCGCGTEFTSQEVVPVFSCAAPEPRADKQAKTIAGIIVAAGALGKVTHAGDLKICGKSILDKTP